MSNLTTRNGGNRINDGQPLRRTFQPDYGIVYEPVTRWWHRVPPLTAFVIAGTVIGLAVGLYRSF